MKYIAAFSDRRHQDGPLGRVPAAACATRVPGASYKERGVPRICFTAMHHFIVHRIIEGQGIQAWEIVLQLLVNSFNHNIQ